MSPPFARNAYSAAKLSPTYSNAMLVLSARSLGEPNNCSGLPSHSSHVLRSGSAQSSSSPPASRATTLGIRTGPPHGFGIRGNNNNNNNKLLYYWRHISPFLTYQGRRPPSFDRRRIFARSERRRNRQICLWICFWICRSFHRRSIAFPQTNFSLCQEQQDSIADFVSLFRLEYQENRRKENEEGDRKMFSLVNSRTSVTGS